MNMADIKLITKKKSLKSLIEAVRIYSDEIGMDFCTEKWAILIMKSRILQMT